MTAIHQVLSQQQQKNKKTTKKKINPYKDVEVFDYLDYKFLEKFINDQGKILPRRLTGVTPKQQRRIAKAVKYARHLALLPFVAQDIG
ncbi:MAG: 30S ribosomal protein S18 [Candidatus Kapaibacterium sp.]|jgi:small subunit ribosomal protein S18|nr:MAG: 30S ribosomal protein S18 [Candidatus Kapabacteria bacterium]ROL56754.1 MAG: 30S ribosomal protein S18 [Bacteroidetes/Chlorobi group bacterium Naka2016]